MFDFSIYSVPYTMLDAEAQIWIKLPHPVGAYGLVVNQHKEL